MAGIKPIPEMHSDVVIGDFVKLHISGRDNYYVGYIWHKSREEFDECGGADRYTVGLRGADIFLSPLSPEGFDEEPNREPADFCLENRVQIVGINTTKSTLGDIPLTGYEILERKKRG